MFVVDGKRIDFYGNVKFRCLPYLGSGSHSDIYKIMVDGKEYALKVFNELYMHEQNLEKYERKININIDSYVFPQKLLYINNNFKGYLMKFQHGKDLSRRNLDVSIDEFASSCMKLIEDTHSLSNLNYTIYDNHISNIMYDRGFKLIDTDDYIYNPNKLTDEIDNLNMKRLNDLLITIFINSTGIASLIFQSYYIKDVIEDCTVGKITFEELFNEICMIAYNTSGDEVKKVSDIGKVLGKKYSKN